jgi:hypothetical protein
MSPVGFEATIPASARPQTYALDRATTGIGFVILFVRKFMETASIVILKKTRLPEVSAFQISLFL